MAENKGGDQIVELVVYCDGCGLAFPHEFDSFLAAARFLSGLDALGGGYLCDDCLDGIEEMEATAR